ncbi:MAG: type II secretion system protein [Bacilli bacterium]
MKTKKGFTLIELLAVIAILAILVVIAVPSVLQLFNKGKDSAFISQAKTLYKAAKDEVTLDVINNSTVPPAYNNTTETLSIDVPANIEYNIEIKGEKIISFSINDGKKQIVASDSNNNGIIDIEEITNVTDKK